jgi:hypothetical protein
MRHRILLVLVVLVAIIPLAAGHPWRPAAGALSAVPGVALADISLGMPIGEVLSRFGTPSAVRLTGGNGLLGYGFDRYGITVYAHGDIVQAVATTNSVVGAVNGIGLGTPRSEVLRTLGQSYSPGTVEGFPGVVYGGAGVAFGLDHDAVAAILIFRSAGAAPAQPGSPVLPSGPATSQVAPVDRGAVTAGPSRVLPDISRLKPYTAETHYLSLAGYLRYLMRDTSKTRMTTQDGDRLMRQSDRLGAPQANRPDVP